MQILFEYDNIIRSPNESVQDYCNRFNNIYNVIPANIKPPPDLALIKFPDGFDANMPYQLRERNLETLEQMHSNAVSVEANLLAKKAQMRNEKKVVFKEEASASNGRVDVLAKSLERIMDRLEKMKRKNQWENQQQQPPIRNPNFRKNPNAAKNTTPDQHIRLPFQENYVAPPSKKTMLRIHRTKKQRMIPILTY